jgi:hypothetical protein
VELDEALVRIQVAPAERECATAPARGLDVQAQQQAVEVGVVAR